MKVFLASRNRKKIEEMERILREHLPDVEVLGIDEKGHDYFLQMTDARPDTGGLSGATPAEAVSPVSSRIRARMAWAVAVALGEGIFGAVTSR